MSEINRRWANVQHLPGAIIALRRKYPNTNSEELFLKLFRLIYTELDHAIGQQGSLVIEILSRLICERPIDDIIHLDVTAIRSVIELTFNDNFDSMTKRILFNTCSVCNETFPQSQTEQFYLCNHSCCLVCLKEYYRNAIIEMNDRSKIKRLACPLDEHSFSEEELAVLRQYLATKVRHWFSEEPKIIERYEEKILRLHFDSSAKTCGNPRCSAVFIVDNGNVVNRITCPHCEFAQCQLCGREWKIAHRERSCEEYEDWLAEEDPDNPDVQARKYLELTSIVCPNPECLHIYQYQAGECEHFTCGKCSTEFCRVCSTIYYSTKSATPCAFPNCTMRTLHCHCPPNCLREIRDAPLRRLIEFATENDIDIDEVFERRRTDLHIETFENSDDNEDGDEEVRQRRCRTENCGGNAIDVFNQMFCEKCCKEFICIEIWKRHIEPWELYEDNNLVQLLRKAGVATEENTSRDQLIALAQEHLNQTLGTPRRMPRINR